MDSSTFAPLLDADGSPLPPAGDATRRRLEDINDRVGRGEGEEAARARRLLPSLPSYRAALDAYIEHRDAGLWPRVREKGPQVAPS